MKSISKIVLTGGPCAGKTTAMSWIDNFFTKLGYKVLFVPETATELITGGVTPWTCCSNIDYQCHQMKLQIVKEEIFQKAAEGMQEEKILIVCDRGMMDNHAYMSDEDFEKVINIIHKSETEIRDHYDAVFHLVTAANGSVNAYLENKENNPARIESVEEAIEIDNKLIAAWTGHPHFRVIDNSTNFENKMKRLISEISGFLGEPEPYEIERKYLIKFPDLNLLESSSNCKKVEIIQTYLRTDNDEEVRIRQRGSSGSYVYFMTTKKKITSSVRVEIEKRLSQNEYLCLLMQANTNLHQIRKTRYCLMYKSQYFEIDIYPFWKDKAIMEIELLSEVDKVIVPDFIEIIKEVTNDDSYKNASLAKLF